MDSVFIVRLRTVPREIEGKRPLLRGTIEHVPSGRTQAVVRLSDITEFIASLVREAGVDLDPS